MVKVCLYLNSFLIELHMYLVLGESNNLISQKSFHPALTNIALSGLREKCYTLAHRLVSSVVIFLSITFSLQPDQAMLV